jgi:LuxR family maltose regulon positive regulatory protein
MSESSSTLRLLRTKLFAPRVHAELVGRPRLLTRLDEGAHCTLTLLSAPAGFGKTTLLATWISQRETPVAWLSLDERDNDPPRFWMYVIAALRTVWSDVGETASAMLRAPESPPIESVLTELLNDVATQDGKGALVLDDYHVVTDEAIHGALTFLLENRPPQLRIVIASRVDPPLSLPRLRARRELVELRAADLRFTAEEAEAFFQQVEGLSLDADDVAALELLTEGWAAGLQLAALSMLQVEDVSAFIRSFSGSHRYVFDYLAHEILAQQDAQVRDFLLATAILDRLSAPLCNAVTSKGDAQAMLEQLEAANLFVVPLDQQRRWYRYHRLFSDFLKVQLDEERTPAEIAELHRRASAWYENQGDIADAIRHALDAEAYSRAASLIKQATQEMFERSELRTLHRWLAALPDALLEADVFLSMVMAWVMLATGQFEAVEPHVRDVERLVGVTVDEVMDPATLPIETRGALAEIACVRATLAFNVFDLARVKALAQLARSALTDPQVDGPYNENLSLRSVAAFNLASAYEYSGETSAAIDAFEEAVALTREDENLHLLPMAISHLGQQRMVRGKLHAAAQTYEQALQSVEGDLPRSPLAGMAYTGLAGVLYEWNDLERAAALLEQGLALGKRWASWDILLSGYVTLANVALAQRAPDRAMAQLDALVAYAEEREEIEWALPAVAAHRALLDVRRGNVEAAARWAVTCPLDDGTPIAYVQENDALVLAHVWLAEGKLTSAAQLLERLLAANEAAERWGRVIRVLVLRALVYAAQEQREAAVDTLTRALELAEPEGYVRTFVDAGAPLRTLLEDVAVLPAYVARLRAAFTESPAPEPPEPAAKPASAQPLVEPLTERELDVLRLIAQGLTNQEIADALFISVNTVKTHAKHIYDKLNVRNRAQATIRATELGLL